MITTERIDENTKLVTINVKELCAIPANTTLDLIARHVLEAGKGYFLIVNVDKINISDVQRHSKTIEDIAKLFQLLPEVSECEIINAPNTFQNIFRLIKPFIDAATMKKIKVIPKKKNNEDNIHAITSSDSC